MELQPRPSHRSAAPSFSWIQLLARMGSSSCCPFLSRSTKAKRPPHGPLGSFCPRLEAPQQRRDRLKLKSGQAWNRPQSRFGCFSLPPRLSSEGRALLWMVAPSSFSIGGWPSTRASTTGLAFPAFGVLGWAVAQKLVEGQAELNGQAEGRWEESPVLLLIPINAYNFFIRSVG